MSLGNSTLAQKAADIYAGFDHDGYEHVQAREEIRTAEYLSSKGFAWVPEFTLYEVSRLVTAMRYYPINSVRFDQLPGDIIDEMNRWASDIGYANVGFDPETGEPYVIDLGCGSYQL